MQIIIIYNTALINLSDAHTMPCSYFEVEIQKANSALHAQSPKELSLSPLMDAYVA